jgi:glycogen operon protein
MLLSITGDTVLVWFNRRMEPVQAKLPAGDWQIGMSSDDPAKISVAAGAATLLPRSVLALTLKDVTATPAK